MHVGERDPLHRAEDPQIHGQQHTERQGPRKCTASAAGCRTAAPPLPQGDPGYESLELQVAAGRAGIVPYAACRATFVKAELEKSAR